MGYNDSHGTGLYKIRGLYSLETISLYRNLRFIYFWTYPHNHNNSRSMSFIENSEVDEKIQNTIFKNVQNLLFVLHFSYLFLEINDPLIKIMVLNFYFR